MVINHARQEAILTARPWRLEIDTEDYTFIFQTLIGKDFIQAHTPPVSETRLQPDILLADLVINGQNAAKTGRINLFPTGEQDPFSLTMISGGIQRILSMGQQAPSR